MTYTTRTNVSRRAEVASRINVFGSRVLRCGLVLVIGWIGLMKFIGYEARGIEPFVAHSPLLGWGYHIWRVRQFSAGLGVVEIVIALLIDIVKTYRAVRLEASEESKRTPNIRLTIESPSKG